MVENQIQDETLNEIADFIFDNIKYMQIDTSTTLPSETDVELNNGGLQIGNSASLFNKERDLSEIFSKVVDNKSVMQFTLASGEPYSQPVNIGSFGMMKQITAGGGLRFATALPVTFTKSNQLSAKMRAEIGILRIGDV